MFSKTITNSARFLKMPKDSQTLYFHLGLAADDDGIVEAWSVLNMTGSGEDNLRVLATKGFITVLNEDLVSYVMDWHEHNALRADRLITSTYRELLIQMIPEVTLTTPKPRSDVRDNTKRLDGPSMDGVGEDRIGKDRLDTSADERREVPDDEEKKPKSPAKYPNAKKIFSLWGDYPKHWERQTTFLLAAEEFHNDPALGYEEAEYILKEWYPKNKDKEYCPQIHNPHDLLTKHSKLEAFSEKKHD